MAAEDREARVATRIRELTRGELIERWHQYRTEYNNLALKSKTGSKPRCVMCKQLYRRQRLDDRGKGAVFYKGKDGSYIGECGGGGSKGPCKGLRIPPADYIDSATLRKELHGAKDELMRELKHVRDRVFGTEKLTKEDDEAFRALTREYTAIRKMEEQYKSNLPDIGFTGSSYVVEDRRPETSGGANLDSMVFRSNKILVPKKDKTVEFDSGDMVFGVVCKEDLPVQV